jgi:hypothetical protein
LGRLSFEVAPIRASTPLPYRIQPPSPARFDCAIFNPRAPAAPFAPAHEIFGHRQVAVELMVPPAFEFDHRDIAGTNVHHSLPDFFHEIIHAYAAGWMQSGTSFCGLFTSVDT